MGPKQRNWAEGKMGKWPGFCPTKGPVPLSPPWPYEGSVATLPVNRSACCRCFPLPEPVPQPRRFPCSNHGMAPGMGMVVPDNGRAIRARQDRSQSNSETPKNGNW